MAVLIQAREQPLESISAHKEIEIRIGGQSIRVAEPRAVSVPSPCASRGNRARRAGEIEKRLSA
jgi:hypothetical protein